MAPKLVPVGTYVRRVRKENWRIGHVTGISRYPWDKPPTYWIQFAVGEPSIELERGDFRVVQDQKFWRENWADWDRNADSKKPNRP